MKSIVRKNIKATLRHARYPREMVVSGEFTEEQLEDMRNNIGRDFIIRSANNSFNLKYFDSVVFEQIGDERNENN